MNSGPAIQREIKSVVDLALAHAHKIYYSGPLVRRIERLPDGHKPARDEGWVDVWAQLGGTTLSVWDMKAIEEANKRGEEVPPSYINITDCVSIYYFPRVISQLTLPVVRSGVGCINKPPYSYIACEKIYQCYYFKYCGLKHGFLRLSIFSGIGSMG